MVSEIMTVQEVAEFLRLHQNTIYHQIETGELPYFRIGKSIRFSREQVEKHLYMNEEVNDDRATLAGQKSS